MSGIPDFSNFKFLSTDHIRYHNGNDVSGHNTGCKRGIEIKTHPEIAGAYLVTIFNLDGRHPVWGDTIQMAPKRMKLISTANNIYRFVGFGTDQFGVPFSHYGISVYLENDTAQKIVLHLFDKGVDIEYI